MKTTRRGPALVAVGPLIAVLVAALAGCTDSARESAVTGAGSFDWDVAFAKCMRDAGHEYPDPKPDAGAGPVQIPADDSFERDRNTCTETVTKDRGARPVTEAERKDRDHWNDVYGDTVDCLRKKGYDVEVTDGGYSAGDQITETDMATCAKNDGSQSIGGAQ